MGCTILLPQYILGQSRYPDWFLHSQNYPDLYVGYSIAGVIDAKADAVWRHSFLEQGYLSGTATYFNDDDKWEKDYITEAEAPTLDGNKLVKIDRIPTSLYGGGEEIGLFKIMDSGFDELTQLGEDDYPVAKAPDWVNRGPYFTDASYSYGVGQYVLHGNENDAWRTAEERALIEIASAVGLEVESRRNYIKTRGKESTGIDEEESILILTYTFNHAFRDARILERWVEYPDDSETRYGSYVYVLIQIPTKSISYQLPGEK